MGSKYKHFCRECGESVRIARVRYLTGRKLKLTCMECGQKEALKVVHTTAPLNKSNYIHIYNPETLKDLNPKYIRSVR